MRTMPNTLMPNQNTSITKDERLKSTVSEIPMSTAPVAFQAP